MYKATYELLARLTTDLQSRLDDKRRLTSDLDAAQRIRQDLHSLNDLLDDVKSELKAGE